MKLGVTAWNLSDMSAASLSEQAKLAESLGYDSFWLPENHFSKLAIPDPVSYTHLTLPTTPYV